MPSKEIADHNQANVINNRYQVHHLIKEKNFVRVFAGLDTQTQKRVLIKDLCWRDVSDWKSFELFEREVKNLTYLNHPRIPKFIEYFQAEEAGVTHYYLVSEFISGETLSERLEKGWKVSEAIAHALAKELLEILIYLHHFSPPVIHRDIKPKNIMLDSEDRAYLVDFDAVKDLAKPGDTVVGTFGYMAPEQYSNQVKPASDLYALGITLVEMLSRCTPDEIPRKDLHLDYHELVNISPEFSRWLDTLVEPLLSKRCVSAEYALETLLKPELLQPKQPQEAIPVIQSADATVAATIPVVKPRSPRIIPLAAEPVLLPENSRIEIESDGREIYIPAHGKIMPMLGDWFGIWVFMAICVAPIYWLSTFFFPFWVFQVSLGLAGFLGLSVSVDAFKNTFMSLGITIDEKALNYEQKWFGRFGAKTKSQAYESLSLIDCTDTDVYIKLKVGKDNVVTNLHARLTENEQAWARDHLLSKIKEHVSEEQFQRLLIDPDSLEEGELEENEPKN